MLVDWFIVLASIGYLLVLFAVAYIADKRAERGAGITSHPYIYALSLGVYCTSWTFYGSVGRAASSGLDFLPIYIGPTLVFILWWLVIRKIIRITKAHRITSIADFISSRYGKSSRMSILVTVIAVVGIVPYISLQLKAVATSFNVLKQYPEVIAPSYSPPIATVADTAFWVALVMALFAILFGTRTVDNSEHHEGVVVAIAFESVVKLLAFLAVGIFVTYGLYDGLGDLFAKASAYPELVKLMTFEQEGAYTTWITLTTLSMVAAICLPRQFQVMAVENVNEPELRKGAWLFPLYLLAINIFVLPIALGGLLQFPDGAVNADTFVLTLPMAHHQEWLALFVFLGGLSAATGMVIVATIALSTMVSNDLVMPALLQLKWLGLTERGDFTGIVLFVRRSSILLILFLGYAYFRFLGESDALVTIGLISFAAVFQFAPAMLGGMFWKGGNRSGALTGLFLGFIVWAYTLLLPSFAKSGILPLSFITEGPLGIELLKPYALFDLQGLDNLTHALFWTTVINVGAYVFVSLYSRHSALERVQGALFVDVFRYADQGPRSQIWQGSALVEDLFNLLVRFIGRARADRAFSNYFRDRGLERRRVTTADADLVNFTERLMAGAIGTASARVMISSVVKGEAVRIEEVMKILEETSQVIEYSQSLEQKSFELESTTRQLRAANERLKELDRLKDEFLSTVSHELRTPLTSIRSFSEILSDHPDLDEAEKSRFLRIIVKESVRLTRLINQVLDLAKIEAGQMEWVVEKLDVARVIENSMEAMSALLSERTIQLEKDIWANLPAVKGDRDRLMQVIVNLLSNAVKFCDPDKGRVKVSVRRSGPELVVLVSDNGRGIPWISREKIFEKFHQSREGLTDKPHGTGLGLSISRQIVEYFGGRLELVESSNKGSVFGVFLPVEEGKDQIQVGE
ncbi:sensor histidine kinase [Kiloniella laminariae]|uniref:histidine kinase n=1 Tax=Kiloniella laminariae TaxID=454162 RepID=A0ABT4LDT8_9PROT|nr:sensor histidine kinase [Kiloniella laminariae]MCZ4279266.1 sensor histidine kinase [Kiloniella laminariae]